VAKLLREQDFNLRVNVKRFTGPAQSAGTGLWGKANLIV
jgi:hypothetical protein